MFDFRTVIGCQVNNISYYSIVVFFTSANEVTFTRRLPLSLFVCMTSVSVYLSVCLSVCLLATSRKKTRLLIGALLKFYHRCTLIFGQLSKFWKLFRSRFGWRNSLKYSWTLLDSAFFSTFGHVSGKAYKIFVNFFYHTCIFGQGLSLQYILEVTRIPSRTSGPDYESYLCFLSALVFTVILWRASD